MKIEYDSVDYKYQLRETYEIRLPWAAGHPGRLACLELQADGTLILEDGFGWNGPSYPGSDTPDTMVTFGWASAVHDALYRLMRAGKLDYLIHRANADDTMRELCLRDGMAEGEANFVYNSVRKFGELNAMPPELRPHVSVWPEGSSGE